MGRSIWSTLSIGEAIAWIGLIMLIIWIILKISGMIQSPLLLEIAPLIMLCLILGSLIADVKNIKSEIRRISNTLIKLCQDFRQLKGEYEIIKSKKH